MFQSIHLIPSIFIIVIFGGVIGTISNYLDSTAFNIAVTYINDTNCKTLDLIFPVVLMSFYNFMMIWTVVRIATENTEAYYWLFSLLLKHLFLRTYLSLLRYILYIQCIKQLIRIFFLFSNEDIHEYPLNWSLLVFLTVDFCFMNFL